MATKVYLQSPPHRHNPPLPDLQAEHPKARDSTYLSLSCKKPELRDCLIRRMLKGAPVPRDPLGCISSGDLECAPLAWTSSCSSCLCAFWKLSWNCSTVFPPLCGPVPAYSSALSSVPSCKTLYSHPRLWTPGPGDFSWSNSPFKGPVPFPEL